VLLIAVQTSESTIGVSLIEPVSQLTQAIWHHINQCDEIGPAGPPLSQRFRDFLSKSPSSISASSDAPAEPLYRFAEVRKLRNKSAARDTLQAGK
jgi:hypothetical protein